MKRLILLMLFALMTIFSFHIDLGEVYAEEIVFSDKTVYYNGQAQNILVEGLPDDVEVIYNNNSAVIPGEYEASATFMNGEEEVTLTATLTIMPALITGITLPSSTFEYDGEEKSLEVNTLTLPYGETATVLYTNNVHTDVNIEGYTVSAFISHSCYESLYLTSQLFITYAEYDLSGITFENQIFTYDGQIHNIEYQGELPEGLSVAYTNNGQVDASSYLVEMSFVNSNMNYITPDSKYAYLIINPKIIDVTIKEMTFNNTLQTVLFDVTGVIGNEDAQVKLGQYAVYNAGEYNTTVTCQNNNYVANKSSMIFYVKKAVVTEVNKPQPSITYFNGIKLKDIKLPTGFNWVDADRFIYCNNTSFDAIYNMDSINYEDLIVSIYVEINKASISAVFPSVSSVQYGKQLRDVIFESNHVLGEFRWRTDTLYPTVVNSGYIMELIPFDTVNYNTTSRLIPLEVIPLQLQLDFDNYNDVVYNGEQHKNVTASINGMLERDKNAIQLSLRYDGNVINAGQYKVEAYINNPNYILPTDNYVLFKILKADLDINNITYVVSSDKLSFNQEVSYRLNVGEWTNGVHIESLTENTEYTLEYYIKGSINYNDSTTRQTTIKTTYSVNTVNSLIENLGEITLSSYNDLHFILNAYNSLLEQDKQLVSVNTLLNKMDRYNDLCSNINDSITVNVNYSDEIWKGFLISLSTILTVISLLVVARRFV